MHLARETGQVLAWDTSRTIYLLDAHGELAATWSAPERIATAAWSESGTAAVVLTERGTLWWLDGELTGAARHGIIRNPSALAIDPHGQYTLVSSLLKSTFIIDRHGKLVTELETPRPLVLTLFLLAQPYWIGAADHGLLGCYTLEGDPVWEDRLWSSVGALAATPTGQMILVACYGHGIQRYARRGENEGAYQLPGPVRLVSCAVDGAQIAAATLEARLTLLDRAGCIVWDAALPEPAAGLALDALGRYVIFGLPAGEVSRWDLVADDEAHEEGSLPVRVSQDRAPTPPAPKGRLLREPDWSADAVANLDEARVAVPGVLDAPLRLALMTSNRRLKVYAPSLPTASGQGGQRGSGPDQETPTQSPAVPVHVSDRLSGRGRVLRARDGYLVAGTDREILVYNAWANTSTILPNRLVEISHLALASDASRARAERLASIPDSLLADFPPVPGDEDFHVVAVECRDRINLLRPDGEVRWVRQLKELIQDVAAASSEAIAVTTDDGWLLVFDLHGELRGRQQSQPVEPMSLVAIQDSGTAEDRFVTATREAQLVCGYDDGGEELWRASVPFQPWRLTSAQSFAVVLSSEGATFAVDSSGNGYLGPANVPPESLFFPVTSAPRRGHERHPQPQVAASREETESKAGAEAGHSPRLACLFAQGSNLTCVDWTGNVLWRHVASAPLGPIARGKTGACALLGTELAWFADDERQKSG